LMTFDICVPSLNIIFDFQGYQHYYDHYMFGDVKFHREHDVEKRALCTTHNFGYLEVPYWWQHDKESVIAILNNLRPDIVLCTPMPIPFHYAKKSKPIKDLTVTVAA